MSRQIYSDYSIPATALRFVVTQYCEFDPVEMAVEIRDDGCAGGCIIYGRFSNSERWHCNESSRPLVRLLLNEVDRLKKLLEDYAPPVCDECGLNMINTDEWYCMACGPHDEDEEETERCPECGEDKPKGDGYRLCFDCMDDHEHRSKGAILFTPTAANDTLDLPAHDA